MRRIYLMILGFSCYMLSFAQPVDTLTLENCLRISNERSPINRQKILSSEILSNKIKNINTNWLPSAGINAQAIYNSETVDFSDVMKNMPVSIPSLPLDQYKIWADINQQIYDGGINKAQKSVEKANYETEIQQTEIELLAIRQQVSQIYFSLLLTQQSSRVLNVSINELSERKRVIISGINNGIILSENLPAIEAEEIGLKQKLTELELTSEQLRETLSILLDSAITSNMYISEPKSLIKNDKAANRPELLFFESQKNVLKANQKIITSADMPKIYAFSQLAYGRPGYNIVDDEFHGFYSVGLGMKWNFINYGDSKRQKKILEIQKDNIEIKRESFLDKYEIQLQTEKSNIEKFNRLMEQDKEIIKLRQDITSAGMSKLKNGIITSTEYLTDMNAEIIARLQYENHKILKIQAEYNYMIIQGKL